MNRLKQVVLNFLSNAYKFTPHNGTVSVRIEPPEEAGAQPVDGGGDGDRVHVRVSVSDTGCGISKAEGEKLFQPWSQVWVTPTSPSTLLHACLL